MNGVSPPSGPTAGGTSITITGSGFVAGATVTLGGTAASNVAVLNSTSITALTPAHAAGGVDVVVTNPNAQTGTNVGGFTYFTPQTSVPLFDRAVSAALDTLAAQKPAGAGSQPEASPRAA